MAELSLQRRLADLLRKAELPVAEDRQVDLLRYLEELARWNRSHNLTAVSEPVAALETHLVDSLTLLPLLPESCTLLDFGSGAGLPGLPLRIVRDDLRLTSLDAVGKKLAFQRHLARVLRLRDIDFVHARLEDFSAAGENHGRYQRIVFRAVGEIDRFAPLVLPLLEPGGLWIAMKGPDGQQDWKNFCGQPLAGFRNHACLSLKLPSCGAERNLLCFEKE
ncbi:16S rRNA (guanine(527)-N(7))-methyltransferase RsmG [Geothermobacter hydrogeniphilus]|uniref:Ribosomal RNA small subunit methyltransferase G n=1 Tax=Geothermobacter hydrogeniphilus TaxID=1969733 RepID=A0A1X0XZJ0_9BACT|nr:16S rRNA (guanine(527)-N(7))-methyltransferase RsmG [Geothermobacter hydrogeniphilus]ORJ58258.1 16S rRNA (guanine(527)-N(7))-methyltransferase RsmG [Geothermobacter hydrogeniphilus]